MQIGIGSVSTGNLGDNVVGFLSSLGSGGTNSLVSGNTTQAQKILDAAIQQVATLRGRLGAFQKDMLDTNINKPERRAGKRDRQRKSASATPTSRRKPPPDPRPDPGAGQHVRPGPGQCLAAERAVTAQK